MSDELVRISGQLKTVARTPCSQAAWAMRSRRILRSLGVVAVGLPLVLIADEDAGAVVAVGAVTDLAAAALGALADGGAGFDEVAKGVGRDFVKVLQDELAQVAVEQHLRRLVALATALVDAVGDGEEDLGLGDAAGHGVGEEDVAAVGDHAVERGHDLGQRGLEALDADLAAFCNVVPVELVFGPGLEGEFAQHFGGRWRAGGRVHVKAGHQGHVDDLAAQVLFGGGEFFVVERAQRAVGLAAATVMPMMLMPAWRASLTSPLA
ncbi:hypothetical protein Y695_03738 [Hydrogenophaga sp. T4]|nr:hypothetical protein Y695_03738 [Hydrogenophaga sp. T4]